MNKIAIFIPCYNVSKKIRRFLNNFNEETLRGVEALICVDNASEDSTLKILKDVKKKNDSLSEKLVIISNRKNYGLGGSHKIVFNYLLEHDYTHCLIIPSSYKGSPKEIVNLFCNQLKQEPDADVIFGVRDIDLKKNLNTHLVERFERNISDPLKHLLADYKFSDIGSRFILISTDAIKKVPYKSLSDSKEFNLQLNVLLSEISGLKILEIPLKKWTFSKVNRLKTLSYNGKLVKTMARYGINKYFFQKSGWRLFTDFPDNKEREFEVL